MIAHGPFFHDPVQIVGGDAVGEAPGDVADRRAPLLVAHHLGVDEHGALLAAVHGVLCGKGQTREVPLDADAELFRLFFKETARPGGAGLVHGEILDEAALQPHVFGILPPDLENGVHFRADECRSRGMGRDLVDHHVRPGQIPDEMAPRAGHAHGLHVRKLPVPFKDIPEPRPHRLDGTAGGHEVVLRHDLTVFIHEHDVGGDGTDVDAEEHAGTALQRQAQAAPDRIVVRRERGSRRSAGGGGRRAALRDARLGTPRQAVRFRSVRQGGGGRTERRHEPCGNLRPAIRRSPASRRGHADRP